VQHCSGASAACDGDVTGDWSVPPGGDCTIDQICMLGGSGGEVYGTTGSCHTCEYGCDNTTEDGGCLSACDPADPCCGSDGNVLPSSEVCLTWTELECSGSGCGDDVQQGSMVQHCSGVGSLCDGMITSTWTVLTDCSDDQLCADDGTTPGCETCPFGCAELGGVGACYPECRPAEPCCTDGGMFRPDTFVCDSWSVQTCVPDQSCGSDVYGIEVVQSCSGDGPDCDGAIDEGTTTLLVPCGPNDMCSCSTSGATGDLTCTCSPDSAC